MLKLRQNKIVMDNHINDTLQKYVCLTTGSTLAVKREDRLWIHGTITKHSD